MCRDRSKYRTLKWTSKILKVRLLPANSIEKDIKWFEKCAENKKNESKWKIREAIYLIVYRNEENEYTQTLSINLLLRCVCVYTFLSTLFSGKPVPKTLYSGRFLSSCWENRLSISCLLKCWWFFFYTDVLFFISFCLFNHTLKPDSFVPFHHLKASSNRHMITQKQQTLLTSTKF